MRAMVVVMAQVLCEDGLEMAASEDHRSVDLAPQHCHLVTKHDDLDREVRVLATREIDKLEDAKNARLRNDRFTARWSSHQPTGCQSPSVWGVDGISGTWHPQVGESVKPSPRP